MAQDTGNIQIREMIETDLLKVINIDTEISDDERTPTWPFSFESYWQLYRPDIHLVAELEGEIVGFVVGNIVEEEHNQSLATLPRMLADFNIHRHRWVGWIDMIGVTPRYQHKGIGRALVEEFLVECKRNNAVMRGFVREGDERLEKFLKAMGFRKWDFTIYEKS